jgi:antitoxin component HigA of HigAB toxin-antitoxin module
VRDPELSGEAEYEEVLEEIDRLLEMELEKGSPEHEELRRLQSLVEDYEQGETRAKDPDDFPVADDEEE